MFGRATITLGIGPHSSSVCAKSLSEQYISQTLRTWTNYLWIYVINVSIIAYCILWPPYVIGQTVYIFILFLSSSSFFISSPNLSNRRLDVCHTFTHGVALV